MQSTPKRKVLFYLSTFPVFSENFITREIEALNELGNLDISILALQKGTKAEIPKSLKSKVFYFSKSKALRILDFVIFYLTNTKKAHELLEKYKERKGSLITAVSLSKKIKDISPEVIHANWITEGALMANMLSDITGIPYSIECHALDIWSSSQDSLKIRIKNAKFVATCTQFNVNFLKNKISQDLWSKLNTIYHYIDPNIFNGKAATFINEKPIIYLIGRMVEKKGYEYMIKSAKILKDKGMDFEVRFAGDKGTEKEKLQQLVKELGLNETVKFLDEIKFEEHSHNYLESDIFVAPSIESESGDMDGIPNVIIEAMLAGLPVIASNISAISEVVEDTVTGFLVKQKDEKELASKIEILLKNKELRTQMGSKGSAKIKDMFSKENTILKLESLLK